MKPKNLKEALKNELSKKEIQYLISSYDMVGDIAIIEVPYELEKKEAVIADTLLKLHKNINVVVKKTSEHKGVFRLQKYKVIAGEKRKKTEYVESGVRMRFNIERVYFSTRFGTERLRIARLVKQDEDVLVMFSGVAPFPLVIARNSDAKEIYGIEINPVAHKYGLENVKLNKMEDKIKLYEGDVRMIVPTLRKKFDRVVMPLPKGGESFLDMALKAVKGNGVVHFYDFLHVDDFSLAKKKIREACKKAGKRYKTQRLVKCGQQKPYVYRICLDVKVYD
ncbi:class I SAM-dependent methyltransferase family protein [Candidatus Woesearchaeota archaeon]|nr:class I SAM-dependent methyltransferase family protein [Candidatus Woesearchaeota archaeon]